MKFKALALCVALNLGLISVAHADIIIYAPYASNGDNCDIIAGKWTGSGKATEWGVINCVYNGSVTIETSTPADGNINLKDLTLKLDSSQSSFICPTTETLQLSGQCHNGKIIIQNDMAKLNGDLSEDALHANVTGTVSFNTPIGKLSPDVTMTLNKS